MSSTALQVSALVAVTLFMIVSIVSVGAASHGRTEIAAVAATQLNG